MLAAARRVICFHVIEIFIDKSQFVDQLQSGELPVPVRSFLMLHFNATTNYHKKQIGAILIWETHRLSTSGYLFIVGLLSAKSASDSNFAK